MNRAGSMMWIVGALLFLATAINYLDRLSLSILSPSIRREFHLAEADYAQIVALFLLAYAVMYAASGWIVDRLGTKRGFACFVAIWSLAAMLHGAVTGKWTLAGARILLGISEPGNWPAAAKAVREWFPPRQRALGIGIFNAGATLGAAVAAPLVSLLAVAYGWRAAFMGTGAIGFVWLAVWLAVYRSASRETPVPARRAAFASFFRNRDCLTLAVARFCTDPVSYFVIFWLPEYLSKERHFNIVLIGRYAWIPFAVGGVAYFAGGWASGRLIERGRPLLAARKTVMTLGACVMPVAILAPFAPNAGWALLWISLQSAGFSFWNANLHALPTDVFPSGQVGTATGICGMGGAIGGMLATLGTGWIVTRFHYAPVFVAVGLLPLLALAGVRAQRFREARAFTDS